MPPCTDRFVHRCRHSLLKDVVRLTEALPEEDVQLELGLRLRQAAASIPSQLGDGTTPASAALIDRALTTTAEAGGLLMLLGQLGFVPLETTEQAQLKVSAIRNVAELAARRRPRVQRQSMDRVRITPVPGPYVVSMGQPDSFEGGLS